MGHGASGEYNAFTRPIGNVVHFNNQNDLPALNYSNGGSGGTVSSNLFRSVYLPTTSNWRCAVCSRIFIYDASADACCPLAKSTMNFPAATQPTKEEGIMFSIYKDLKEFVREHKSVLFTLVFVLLLDKYLFEGALRERLKGIINGFLSKAEKIAAKE